MKKFKVTLQDNVYRTYVIEAKSKEEAEEIIFDKIDNMEVEQEDEKLMDYEVIDCLEVKNEQV